MDEYFGNDGAARFVRDTVLSKFREYRKNLKVIITSRLNAGLPKDLHLTETYIRLLPLNEKQVNDYFTHYSIKESFKTASENLGLGKEELTKPLMLQMLCQILPDIRNTLIKLTGNLTSNITKSLIYLNFFHYIILGKYIKSSQITEEKKTELQEQYLYEKRILRIIALLKQIHKSQLTEDIVSKEIRIFGESAILI